MRPPSDITDLGLNAEELGTMRVHPPERIVPSLLKQRIDMCYAVELAWTGPRCATCKGRLTWWELLDVLYPWEGDANLCRECEIAGTTAEGQPCPDQ